MARSTAAGIAAARARAALGRSENWIELLKFSVVGLTGYVVNLAVYVSLLRGAGMHYLPAAVCSFVVAVTNNYLWNRLWTFRSSRGHVYYQGMRFLFVSLAALALNLVILRILVALGSGKILAQAIAIVLVTPFSFSANKLWSFRN
ncbi:MAG TPA: GtrA family protein [Gaiellaceae bacterium]